MALPENNFEAHLNALLNRGNLAYAETLLRMAQREDPDNPKIYYYLGQIASSCQLPAFAMAYFTKAAKLKPGWHKPLVQLAREKSRQPSAQAVRTVQADDPLQAEKYLLIKAWGYGFWSDVSHVLAQLLLAEMTERIPVVEWGNNSWFNDGSGENAFEFYFEKVSSVGIAELKQSSFDFWPPKWNHRNLSEGQINKKQGPYSRIAGIYLLGRTEKVIVSDYYSGVIALLPWIPPEHPLFGLSIDQVYRYLVQRYLHPTSDILAEVDQFHARFLSSQDYLAVHIRGSDKVTELEHLDALNRSYPPIIEQFMAKYDCQRIFLMTDDVNILENFSRLYPGKIITTPCSRTDDEQGIHFKSDLKDRRRLGKEVMMDVYLATRAKAFIGNGSSNISAIMPYLSENLMNNHCLLGPNMFHSFHPFLYQE